MSDWKLKHRDSLLSQIVHELKSRDKHNQGTLWDIGARKVDPFLINVTLKDKGGDVLKECCMFDVLEYVANDVYWDETGDWSDASVLEFEGA